MVKTKPGLGLLSRTLKESCEGVELDRMRLTAVVAAFFVVQESSLSFRSCELSRNNILGTCFRRYATEISDISFASDEVIPNKSGGEQHRVLGSQSC